MLQCEYIVIICFIGVVTIVVAHEYSSYVVSPHASAKTKAIKGVNKLSLLPNTSVCGISAENDMLEGPETDLFEFPWLAVLKYRNNKSEEVFDCGGVLISQKYVVTAAHCVIRSNGYKLIGVRLGEYRLKSKNDCKLMGENKYCADSSVDVSIEESVAHDRRRIRRNVLVTNDIALLRLATDVDFTDFVKPICLPIASELLKRTFEGENHVFAGFGVSRKESNAKVKLMLPVKTNKECSEVYTTLIRPEHICAGGIRGQDSCNGDSGGPLMKQISLEDETNWYCTGIASFGSKTCGQVGKPGVYVRMTKYINWILDNIRP